MGLSVGAGGGPMLSPAVSDIGPCSVNARACLVHNWPVLPSAQTRQMTPTIQGRTIPSNGLDTALVPGPESDQGPESGLGESERTSGLDTRPSMTKITSEGPHKPPTKAGEDRECMNHD